MVYTAAAMIARVHDGSETPARSCAANRSAAIGRGRASRKCNPATLQTHQTRISPVAKPSSGGMPTAGALPPSASAIQPASVSRCARPSR